MRYLVKLSYVGTKYRGWQRQANTPYSIQQKLEDTFEKMTKSKISLIGCGRTDTGVHAKVYYAHFNFASEFSYDPVDRLNRMLPTDIVIHDICPVHDKWHARYDAIRRTYRYYIHTSLDPFLHHISSFYPIIKPDVAAIHEALSFLKSMEDFRYLCLTPDKINNTLVTMYEAKFEVLQNEKVLIFTFTANRFLKSMIRAIMYLVIELAMNKISLEEFKNEATGVSRSSALKLAFPNGLHLEEIVYPEES